VCTRRDGNNNLTSYGYDAAGNVTTITPPAPLGQKSYTYDAAGRVLTAFDGRNTAHYSYDNDDRVTRVAYNSSACNPGACVSYGYDGVGNMTSRVSANGQNTAYAYDSLNRPTTKTIGSLTTSAAYDGASNMTSYTDPQGTVKYGYDPGDQLTSLAEPGGSCTATPKVSCTVFGHDQDNRRNKITFPNGQTVDTAYDNASRIISVTAKTAAQASLVYRNYAFTVNTAGGTDQGVIHTIADQDGNSTTYGYDSMNRLTSAALTPATGPTNTSTWGYDHDGNRTSSAGTGNPTVYTTYNGADQQCWSATTNGTCANAPYGATTYTYDNTGNQTDDAGQTNTFNVFNQLDSTVTGSATSTYTYNDTDNTERASIDNTTFTTGVLGQTAETTAGATTDYIRDPFGNLIAEHTGSTSYYLTTDVQGSIIAATPDTSSSTLAAVFTYDPWGNLTHHAGAQADNIKYRYAGGYLDTSTGLYKLGARYYNPTTGRFNQPDPAQLTGGYAYAGDNPINNTDPTGRSLWGDIAEVTVGVVVGAAAGFALGTGIGELAGLALSAYATTVDTAAIGGAIGGNFGLFAGAAYGGAGGDIQDFSSR
jgi:RHS repeat-associated protein